jgi:hypothetical protein
VQSYIEFLLSNFPNLLHPLSLWGINVVIVVLQELAADAGRNLDHALPSMDAAMHAIQSLTPAELAELRNMKNPSDLVQQVSQVSTLEP